MISDIAFTPAVKKLQEKYEARKSYANMQWRDTVTPELAEFIAARDSFYLGTVNLEGQPYIQHRGGAPGFLKVLDEKHLAFADFRGNRQYISVGALSENRKVSLFLMDYPNRRRIKVWGTAEVVDDDPILMKKLEDGEYGGVAERAVVIEITAWDENCPQHIRPRYTYDEYLALVQSYLDRIKNLEFENQELKRQLNQGGETGNLKKSVSVS